MLLPQQAERLILDLVQPLGSDQTEALPLRAATGRILAAAVTGRLDVPHWDNSAMDGYAVRYADVATCDEQPVTLEIVETIPAGCLPQIAIQPGQCARILTGSMLPAGADTIVIQEVTQRAGTQVTILAAPQPQAFVRRRAEYYQAGAPLLPAGIALSAPDIAVLATAQALQVSVYRRPRVAILSTGDELVAPDLISSDQPLQPGQIVDSNQYALAALVASAGAEPILLGAIPDQPAQIQQAIVQAVQSADLVLSSGGVSVGDYDYVDQILAELGAEIQIRAVAIKPGKPLDGRSVLTCRSSLSALLWATRQSGVGAGQLLAICAARHPQTLWPCRGLVAQRCYRNFRPGAARRRQARDLPLGTGGICAGSASVSASRRFAQLWKFNQSGANQRPCRSAYWPDAD